jgi:hypothetical protein
MCNTYELRDGERRSQRVKRSRLKDAMRTSLNKFLRDGDGTGISSTATSAVAPVAAGATAIGKLL